MEIRSCQDKLSDLETIAKATGLSIATLKQLPLT
jgi:hypothetical protein